VNIVHIGDSHIQADFFTGRVRELLQSNPSFGNGGRGFVFPYSAAHTNNPTNYSVSYSGNWEGLSSVKRDAAGKWGLSGILATTRNPQATLTINPNAGSGEFKTTRVKIFYHVFDRHTFNVNIQANPLEMVSSYLSRDGFIEYEFSKPQSSVTLELIRSEPHQQQFSLQGICLENDDAGIVYHHIGINGAEAATYLRCDDFDKHLRVLKPDLVIISLGANETHAVNFNETAYKENLAYIVKQVRKAAPRSSLMLTSPGDAYRRVRYPNTNPGRARDALYDLADELNVALWDFYQVMGGYKSVDKWYTNGLASRDKLHLTVKGYVFQGELFYEALMEDFRRFWEQKP
jgi:lysophospholipase L1-like esterase